MIKNTQHSNVAEGNPWTQVLRAFAFEGTRLRRGNGEIINYIKIKEIRDP